MSEVSKKARAALHKLGLSDAQIDTLDTMSEKEIESAIALYHKAKALRELKEARAAVDGADPGQRAQSDPHAWCDPGQVLDTHLDPGDVLTAGQPAPRMGGYRAPFPIPRPWCDPGPITRRLDPGDVLARVQSELETT